MAAGWSSRSRACVAAVLLLAGTWATPARGQTPATVQPGATIHQVVSAPGRPAVADTADATPGYIHVVSIGPDGHQVEVSKPAAEAQRVIIELREPPLLSAAGAGRPIAISAERVQVMGVLQQRARTTVHHDLHRVFNGIVATVTAETRAALARLPSVKRIHDDVRIRVELNESVPMIRAPDVWNTYGATGAGVKVAVIDTGIDYTHPDLGGAFGPGHKVVGGWDFVNNDADPMDDFGHGTHVAGIIAANGGLKGVAPGAQLLAYKVLDSQGFGWTSDIIAGIEQAVVDGAKVANLSLAGSGSPDDPGSTAIDNATAAGMLCAVAAANSGPGYQTIGSPGVARTALTVGASTKQDGMASFSSRGYVEFNGHYLIKPDMTAPGYGILSTASKTGHYSSDTGYITLSGTSMATPHVAGAAALLVQLYPSRTPAQLKSMLTGSAHDIGFDALTQGSGRLDVLDAVKSQVYLEPTNLSFDLFANGSGTVNRKAILRVTNSTASSQTYQIGTAGAMPPGSTLGVDQSSVSLPAGASVDLVVSLTVDTVTTPDSPSDSGSYSAAVTVSGTSSVARVPVMFLKTSTIDFAFSSTPLLVQLYNRTAKRTIAFTPTGTRFHGPMPTGTYDIVTVFGDGTMQIVARDQVPITGATVVSISETEATHTVAIAPRDETGALITNRYTKTEAVFGRLGTIDDAPAVFMYSDRTPAYTFTPLGAGWDAAITAGVGCDPVVLSNPCDGKFYNYTWTSANHASSNETLPPADAVYRRLVQTHRPPAGTATVYWSRSITLGYRGTNWYAWWYWGLKVGSFAGSADAVTTSYIQTGVPDLAALRFSLVDDIAWQAPGDTGDPTAATPGVFTSWARLRPDGSFGLRIDPLYELGDSARLPSYVIGANVENIVIGAAPLSGPLFFANSSSGISAVADSTWWPGGLAIRGPILTDASYASDRRGRATPSPWTFDVYKGGTLLGSYLAANLQGGIQTPPDGYRLSGQSTAYLVHGTAAQLTSTVDFDTRLSDKNPPYVGPLQVWSGSTMTDYLTGAGQLQFEARDDVALDTVTVEYKVGGVWMPLASTHAGSWYQVPVPPLGPNVPVGIRVVATDHVGNRSTQIWDPAFVADAAQSTLTVGVTGSGLGRVTSNPSGIDCLSSCSAGFSSGATVTLTATTLGDSIFGGWLGACTGSNPVCVTTVNGAQSTVATFLSGTLSVTVTVDGNGVVTSTPAGIACPGSCTATFTRGIDVTLQAAPSVGSAFSAWARDCAGSGGCTVTLDQDRRVTAGFIAVPTPVLTGFSPANATAGQAGFSLTIQGQNFRSGSVVTWNGASRATTFQSEYSLLVDVLASDVASPGAGRINIVAPANGVVSANRYLVIDNPAPATLRVTAACPDANGDGRCDDGSGYSTLKAAVAAASAGDTISMAPGRYVEMPPLVIDRNINIQGAGVSATVVVPGGDTTSCAGDGQAWVLIPEGVSVGIWNIGLDGSGHDIAQALRIKGAYSSNRWGITGINISHIRSSCASGGTGLYASGVMGLELGSANVLDVGGTGVDVNDGSRVRIWYGQVMQTSVGVHSDATSPTFVGFSRLVGNTEAALRFDGTSSGADQNWWGCNAGPGQAGCDRAVGITPATWIQLRVSAGTGATSAPVTADLRFDSSGVDTTIWGHVPDGMLVAFSADQGVVLGATTTASGRATGTYYAARVGAATVSATLDAQTVSTSLTAAGPAMSVDSVTPGIGVTSGATPVAIVGTGFTTGATVTIGGQPATSVLVVSATSITAATPAHAIGAVDVVVTNPNGLASTGTGAYRFVGITPTITWTTPVPIVYGTALSATQLSATANVAGTFAYSPSLGTVLGAGPGQTLSVTFTPTDTASYASATKTVTIDVTKATPTITWTPPAPIVYGTALSATQLSATANVAGTFAYSPSLGTVLGAGEGQTLSVTFTPTDTASYASATKTVTIGVTKATPTITWPTPAHIVVGTPLSSLQLSATANVAGTFAYAPLAGSVLSAGTQTLSVTFTPADGTNYVTVTGTTSLVVAPAPALDVAPQALHFSGTNTNGTLSPVTAAQTVTVSFTSTAALGWSASSDQPWVHITNGSGVGSGTFTVGIVNPGNVLGSATNATAVVTVTASGSKNTAQTVALTLTLQPPRTTQPPVGLVDSPAQNSTGHVGAIGVTGWVVDDVGVKSVRIYRNCLPFEPQVDCAMVNGVIVVYIGDATLVAGARPDIERLYPAYPQSNLGAWGYLLLTSMLPHIPNQQMFGGQGTLTLYALAEDVEGHQIWLGREFLPGSTTATDGQPTTITMANDTIGKPFGAIDTPKQGETVSGAFWNFGWTLTPDSNTTAGPGDILMPLDGSTQWVYIDGVAVAPLQAYNLCRGTVGSPVPAGLYCDDDVAGIFGNPTPQPPNTPRTTNPTRHRNLDAGRGPQAGFWLDTTSLSNGVHTIVWGVTDSAGRGEGIGSRYFTVLNGAGDAEAKSAAPAERRGDSGAVETLAPAGRRVWARAGFSPDAPYEPLAADADGVRRLHLPALGRIDVWLGAADHGYLVANGTLRPLPPGSRLDPATGRFTWAPGVGYFGTYRLVFVWQDEQAVLEITIR